MKGLRRIIIESSYPISFRQPDAKILSSYLKRRESVCLVAMKKVGIANFVRFFCFHPKAKKHYFGKQADAFLFIYCDLNCLRELTEFSFFQFVGKTLADTIQSSTLPGRPVKIDAAALYDSKEEPKNLQSAFDRFAQLVRLVATGSQLTTVLFLLRFDRLRSLFTSSFFAALQSVADLAKLRLLYVTTSVRPLKELYHGNLSDSEVIFFPPAHYLKPIPLPGLRSVAAHLNLTNSSEQRLTQPLVNTILSLGGGHIMLTRLILLAWLERSLNGNPDTLSVSTLLQNERIRMACEEIWDNLTKEEKQFLFHCLQKPSDRAVDPSVAYLTETGILTRRGHSWSCFSSVFSEWVRLRQRLIHEVKQVTELTKKEEQLLGVLKAHSPNTCDRDQIIAGVWPEYEQVDLTVSDWAIDRLISRLRHKLQLKNEPYEIITIRGKGFRLIKL